MSDFRRRLTGVIPGGAHTYSRGWDQFPSNAPEILLRGKGAYVYTVDEEKILDYGMALRAINVGYAEEEIDNTAIEQIKKGNNLTRPSLVELEAAEKLVDLIESVDMVKFTKNGSTAVTAAIKLARAFTGKYNIVCCKEQPFFSYDDWFIASTPIKKGIPPEVGERLFKFSYNNIESLKEVLENHGGSIACLVMEAVTNEEPHDDFLIKVQNLCKKHSIIFILDEMITGFRWDIKGAQHKYGLNPDITTFGKAMSNGYSVACVAGKKEIMSQGGIEVSGQERLFLLSTTHGAEMSGLGAFLGTVDYIKNNNVIEAIWGYGARLKEVFKRNIDKYNLSNHFLLSGSDCSPSYTTLNENGELSLKFRTLFVQEMIKNKVLMPWISICYRHGDEELRVTDSALNNALLTYRKALDGLNVDEYIQGHVIKPVFRVHN